MKTYKATRLISHDNQSYEAGESLELDDKAAAPLIAIGAVEEKPVEIPADGQGDKGGDDDSASETAATAADAQAQESSIGHDTAQESADAAAKKTVGKVSKKTK